MNVLVWGSAFGACDVRLGHATLNRLAFHRLELPEL